jgi:acyl carrier protein
MSLRCGRTLPMTESLLNEISNPVVTGTSESPRYSQAETLQQVRSTLVGLFQLAPERITLEARLLDDLEIDSIDVVDLMEEIRQFTGKRVTMEDFRSVRTVADLVEVLQRLSS